MARSPFEDWSHVTSPGETLTLGAGEIPFWGDNPTVWNTIVMGGFRLPGICRIGGKGFELRQDRKKSSGNSGEKATSLGRAVSEPEIELKLWTAEHLSAFQQLVRKFLPAPGHEMGPALNVIHPVLALYRISSVQIVKASFPEEKKADEYEVKLFCREFYNHKGKPSTPKAAKGIEQDSALEAAYRQKLKDAADPAHANGSYPRSVADFKTTQPRYVPRTEAFGTRANPSPFSSAALSPYNLATNIKSAI